MKYYKKLFSIVILAMVLVLLGMNGFLLARNQNGGDRYYLVEIQRLATKMESEGFQIDDLDLSSLKYVRRVVLCNTQEALTASSKYDYVVKSVGNSIYRFEYETKNNWNTTVFVVINSILAVTFLLVIFLLFYVQKQILAPFSKLQQIPYELAKGNLTIDIEENKSRFFGKYIWGTNMLRESIEDRRKKELDLHREKKVLLLSLTHDIKTPLSVIKLNAQALSKGLYTDANKQKEVAGSIVGKADEIEDYVTKMIAAAREDFLHFELQEEDFYLSKIMEQIRLHYERKLKLLHTEFEIDSYTECLLQGDPNRLIEVLQNLMENAIKYGDGEKIRISFDKEEDCRLITVSNTGAGLRKEELPHVFDSFYRGSNVGNEAGSGLGLYICRTLMHLMNGDIFVKQEENQFAVTLVVRES